MDNKDMLNDVIVEVVRRELSNAKKMLAALIILSVILFASIAANAIMVVNIMSFETVEETDETYEISTEGNGNNFVNGDQYNDNAEHYEGNGE